jgi:hypothetical protein
MFNSPCGDSMINFRVSLLILSEIDWDSGFSKASRQGDYNSGSIASHLATPLLDLNLKDTQP